MVHGKVSALFSFHVELYENISCELYLVRHFMFINMQYKVIEFICREMKE